MADAESEGWALFRAQPELLLAAVWHVAAKHFPDRYDQIEFVNGYVNARRQYDEKRREDSE